MSFVPSGTNAPASFVPSGSTNSVDNAAIAARTLIGYGSSRINHAMNAIPSAAYNPSSSNLNPVYTQSSGSGVYNVPGNTFNGFNSGANIPGNVFYNNVNIASRSLSPWSVLVGQYSGYGQNPFMPTPYDVRYRKPINSPFVGPNGTPGLYVPYNYLYSDLYALPNLYSIYPAGYLNSPIVPNYRRLASPGAGVAGCPGPIYPTFAAVYPQANCPYPVETYDQFTDCACEFPDYTRCYNCVLNRMGSPYLAQQYCSGKC